MGKNNIKLIKETRVQSPERHGKMATVALLNTAEQQITLEMCIMEPLACSAEVYRAPTVRQVLF